MSSSNSTRKSTIVSKMENSNNDLRPADASSSRLSTVRVALCHISPMILDAAITTEKCIKFIHEAADNEAHLAVFPETFIPAFPYWSPLLPPGEGHEFFVKMSKSSVYADGEEINAIRATAKARNTMVSIGISEKVRYSTATMFNANLIIDGNGEIVVHHRKLVPTFYEKLTWTPGDGYGLKVAEFPVKAPDGVANVKFSNLICGENTNSLARYSMIAQGTNFHISSWPAKSIMGSADSFLDNEDPATAEFGKFDPIHLNRIRCGSACVEGKCYGAIVSAFMTPAMIDSIESLAPEKVRKNIRNALECAPQGETVFLDPSGAVHHGFTVDKVTKVKTCVESLRHEEDVLYADLDMSATIEGKQYHDIVGMYQRFDVFDLKVNRARQQPADFHA